MARKAAKTTGVYEKYEGSGIWYVRYKVKGKTVRKAIGTRQQAIEYLATVHYVRRTGDGVLPATAKRLAKTSAQLRVAVAQVTVGELCDDLLAHIRSRPEEFRDQKNPPHRIQQIRKKFGERPADGIRPFEISDWLDSLTKSTPGKRSKRGNAKGVATQVKVSGATSNRLKATFSAMYRLGKHRDKVKENPAREVKQRKVNAGLIRFLSADEEARLRKVLQAEVDACGPQNEQQRRRVLHRICELDVALGTGMRQSEQYRLQWSDVDFHRRVVVLRDTKNGTPREVHLIDDVMDAFRRLQDLGLDLPESRPGAVFCIGDPKKWWAAALKGARIKGFRWHDLRHTFCSRLAMSGVNLKVIQEAAGHKTIQMSARYAHLDKTSLRNAMAVLNRQG